MRLPCAAGVAEESGSLSTMLPVPLYSCVWSLVINSKLAVELLLGTQACFHCWRLCFNDHGNCGNRQRYILLTDINRYSSTQYNVFYNKIYMDMLVTCCCEYLSVLNSSPAAVILLS